MKQNSSRALLPLTPISPFRKIPNFDHSVAAILPEPSMAAAGQGGLNYDEVARDLTRTLTVTVGPLAEAATGDIITVMWGKLTVSQGTVTAENAGQNRVFTLDVPVRLIYEAGEGVHQLSYTYLHLVSEGVDISRPLEVELKLDVPGGLDPLPDTPYLNENLTSPTISPLGTIIEPSNVSVTVKKWVNYSHDDRLVVIWNGHAIQAVHDESSSSYKVPIPPDVVSSTGVGDVAVTYYIHDRVQNGSLYAPYTVTSVEIEGPGTLERPQAWYRDKNSNGIIDLAVLRDGDVTVRIPRSATPDYFIGPDDMIEVTWSGTTATGQTMPSFVTQYIVPEALPFIFDVTVPNTELAGLAQGTARIFYSLPEKYPGRRSPVLLIKIIGELQILDAPQVPAEKNGNLNPSDVPNGAEVRIPAWLGITSNDYIALNWQGRPAAGGTVTYEDSVVVSDNDISQGFTTFIVPTEYVTALDGGSVTLGYSVKAETGALLLSPSLTLQVRNVEGVILPKPGLPDVKDGVLDPSEIQGVAVLTIPNYTGITASHAVTAHWSGIVSWKDTKPVSIDGTPPTFGVPESVVQANIGAKAVVSYEVAEHGISLPLSFLVGPAIPVHYPAPQVPESSGGELDGNLASATLLIASPSALKAGDIIGGSFAGSVLEQTITAATDGQEVRLAIPGDLILPELGKDTEILYSVSRNGRTWPSDVLTLHVSILSLDAPTLLVNGKHSNALARTSIDVKIEVNAGPVGGLKLKDVITAWFEDELITTYEVTQDNQTVRLIIPASLYNEREPGPVVFWTQLERDGQTLSGKLGYAEVI